MSKPIPTTVTFKHHGEVFEGLVLANKGICWQVELSDGSTLLVQKKHVIQEDPVNSTLTASVADTPEEDEAPAEGSLASMLTQIRASGKVKPAAKKAPTASDTVSLKQLCAECQVEPRIARRRLRKAVGLVGTGSRWEWEAKDKILADIRKAIKG